MAGDSIIEVVGLSRKFGRTRAVDGVSFEVRRGEVLCVVGANGAGKTTLLNLLAGLLYPSGGHVKVFGMDRWRKNFSIRQRTVYLPAEGLGFGWESPYDMVHLYAQLYGVGREDFEVRGAKLADEMAMLPHFYKGMPELSLGMQKKAGLIAAFLAKAELRILDEPMAGGIDPIAIERLYGWFDAARARGETTIFSTQVMDHAEAAADRLLVMNHGAIGFLGTPRDFAASQGIDPDAPRALAKALIAFADLEK